MEAYRKSGHHFTPATCASCHFPDTHNVNKNLDRLSREYIGVECAKCHDKAFNRQWMEGAAMLEEQGKQMLEAGRRIIERLNNMGLLYPEPGRRDPNPAEGKILVLGDHQLYEDTSRAEKLYFEMKKYLQVHLVQGAYHQDFKMAAYEGLIPLRNYLAELQAEALLLEELATEKEMLTPINVFISEREKEDLYHNTYESSFHGVLPVDKWKPDCRTCHVDNDYKPFEPEEMSRTCSECHTKKQVDIAVHDLAEIKNHADVLRRVGRSIIEEIIDKGIVKKSASDRIQLEAAFREEAIQVVGRTLADRMNYYLSDLEESLKAMVAGAAHSNPDYAHWYGNAPAKSDLIEIRDAAYKLEQLTEIYGNRSSIFVWSIAALAAFLVVVLLMLTINRRAKR
jgi:hypothetical protein